jgi:hypothetical protein
MTIARQRLAPTCAYSWLDVPRSSDWMHWGRVWSPTRLCTTDRTPLSPMIGLNSLEVRSLLERFQRALLMTGLTVRPIALHASKTLTRLMTRLAGTDWTCPVIESGHRLFITKTTIALSSELWFRWSWTFWKAYSEGYTTHLHIWSKEQWINAKF